MSGVGFSSLPKSEEILGSSNVAVMTSFMHNKCRFISKVEFHQVGVLPSGTSCCLPKMDMAFSWNTACCTLEDCNLMLTLQIIAVLFWITSQAALTAICHVWRTHRQLFSFLKITFPNFFLSRSARVSAPFMASEPLLVTVASSLSAIWNEQRESKILLAHRSPAPGPGSIKNPASFHVAFHCLWQSVASWNNIHGNYCLSIHWMLWRSFQE